MSRYLILSIVLFLQFSLVFCQQKPEKEPVQQKTENPGIILEKTDKDSVKVKEKISFLFLGDIMSHDLQIKSAYNSQTGKYDFSTEFEHIRPIIKDADVVVGNLEVTLAGPPYKGYPQFSSPDQMAIDIKNAGINYLVTSNNHISDRGLDGFVRTLNVLDSIGFKHTGTFRNIDDRLRRHPMVIEEKGWRIALFNYTYGVNGVTYDPKMLINEIDSSQMINDLANAKKQNFDAIIVYFHWGDEYKRNSNVGQQKIAKLCFENGANVVIGSHPHVIQEMEKCSYKTISGQEKDALVAYSLGNYVANYGGRRYTNGGVLVRFSLNMTEGPQVKIDDQGYFLVWVYRKAKIDTLKTYYVLPVSQFENDKILTGEYLKLFNIFKNDSRAHLGKYNKNVNEYIYDKEKNRWEVRK